MLQPIAAATPAPQAEAVPAGNPGPGNGACRGCGRRLPLRRLPRIALRGVRYAPIKAQICSAMAARLVLYHYDFCDPTACDGYKLSPKGYERLEDIARLFPLSNSAGRHRDHAARAEARCRAAGVRLEVAVADERARAGPARGGRAPRTPALNGQEALELHLNLLQQTKAGGAASGAAALPAAPAGARGQCEIYLRRFRRLRQPRSINRSLAMTTSFAIRARQALGGGLLILLGGCQAFNSWLASFKPGAPARRRLPPQRAVQPITKEQKSRCKWPWRGPAENDGNTEQAIQSYRDVIKKDSGHVEAYHRLAIMYDTKGDVAKSANIT